MNFHKQLTLL